jgi:alpha-galactosidase
MRKNGLILILTLFATIVTQGQNMNLLKQGVPVFHGARVTGNYPNTDFIFTVPATGERPITFSAQQLPTGLVLDPTSGIIKGVAVNEGDYLVKISASNAKGKAEETLKIIIGKTLCLTPAMGWNSWNLFTKNIDEKMLMEMADAMVSTGMRDLGYQYINMDDFWHADSRDSMGRPVANPAKFPHGIKFVADYIHSKGLKLGIYSCAGKMTCGRRFGGYSFEEIDAKTYAEWGCDLLKYDYCYAPPMRSVAISRYSAMANALKHSGRSIVFSICEWGYRKPWLWAAKAGGNYWRATPDIMDAWSFPKLAVYSLSAIRKRAEKLWKYSGPGHWNDLDMLTVGNYGKGNATSGGGFFKGMTDAEYQTEFSLWCMFNSPLLTSCDLRSMNNATFNILTNTEVIALNQDELGEQARPIDAQNGVHVYMRHLQDGSLAVAIFNASTSDRSYNLTGSLLNLKGTYNLRDLWLHQDMGELKESNPFSLQPHQTIVLKLSAK